MKCYCRHWPERGYAQWGFLPYSRRYGLEFGWGWISDHDEGAIAWRHWIELHLPRWPLISQWDERGMRWLVGVRLFGRCWRWR